MDGFDNMEIGSEYGTKEKDKAEIVAFLMGKSLLYDGEESKYQIVSEQQVKNLIKDKYRKGDYLGAEQLLNSLRVISEKEVIASLNDVGVISRRLKMGDYLHLLLSAHNKNCSIADVARSNLLTAAEKILKELSKNENMMGERISIFTRKINEILSLQSTKIRKKYNLDISPKEISKKIELAVDKIFKYYKKKQYKNHSEDFYRFYSRNFFAYVVDEDINDKMRAQLIPVNNKKLRLLFRWGVQIEMAPDRNLSDVLLDLAKLSEPEIKECISDNNFSEVFISLAKKISNEEELIEKLEDIIGMPIEEYDYESIFGNYDFIFNSIELDLDISLENNKIFLENIPLEENKDKIKKIFLEKLIDKDIAGMDEKKYRDEIIGQFDKDGLNEISGIQEKLALKQSGEIISDYIFDVLYSSLRGTQVMTFTISRGIRKFVEAFIDIDKAIIGGDDESISSSSFSKKKEARKIKVKDLMEAGLLPAGAKIYHYYYRERKEATILENGKIKVVRDGETKFFDDPSPAAEYAMNNTGANGWRWWKYKDENGKERTLKELREKLIEKLNSEGN